MTDLERNRLAINEIDEKIAQLFEKRMDASKEIALYKKAHGLQIFDPSREEEVIKRELKLIKNPDYKAYYLEFIHNLMETGKRYQGFIVQGSKVAYCGIEGAWANIAAKRIFPGGIITSYSSFDDAYKAVVKGECDFAVLPIENSFAGDVSQVFDLMYKGPLHINGIYNLHIKQALLGIKGSKLSDIKKVVSHQQAIDQCMAFIKTHKLEAISSVNTAIAAKEVASSNDKSLGAIASIDTARLYNLEVIEPSINENALNTTRFAVFSTVMNKDFSENSKCVFQLMFTVKNIPGALASAVKAFGDTGFNMRSLRSRPIKNIPWQYYFYVEGEGSLFSEQGDKLLASLGEICVEVKVLGHYSTEIDI